MEEYSFGLANYAVLITMLFLSSSIGIYFRFSGGRQKTSYEYLFANGQMSSVPLAFSLMSSFMSAITLLGVSAENYSYGTMFTIHNVAFGLVTPIISHLFVPVYFQLGVTSVYQYLEKRFGRVARLAGSVAFSIQMMLYMGVALYAPALALETITKMPKSHAILLIGFVCTFYSAIGGLKAIIFTDVFQSLLMYAAVFSVIFVAWLDKGSFTEIWNIADAHGRIEFNNVDFDPTVRHTWWNIILGGGVTYLSVYAVNQGQIQRYMSTGKLVTAQKAVWINWPLVSLMSLSSSFAGLAIFSKYARCDPFTACQIQRSDQLMPHYVMDTMAHIPGLPGLFVSGIFSAALSTVSAAMNSLAAVTLEDYPVYEKVKGKKLPDETSLWAKLVSVVYGLLCIVLAFIADRWGGVLQASLTILGVVGGPTVGLFSLGMCFPHANEIGGVSGYIVALLTTFWIGFANKPPPIKLKAFTDKCSDHELYFNSTVCSSNLRAKMPSEEFFYLYRISYLWLSFLGCFICLIVGISVSLVVNFADNSHKERKDPNMFIPPISHYLKQKCSKLNERSTALMSPEDILDENLEMQKIDKFKEKEESHNNKEELRPCLK
ncbi:Putative sodium-dependent multivitamin transporter [Frankliniella fusca]|uniref:Sodium-dependent multivitamin transporter n=1 Tax=Frankliniella fusca TaxID=407009 RepID=A0AAE1L889_9NEOP|nr:Putative sodium-dependent multivitamin transporter [Frankliniella fusca]